MTQSFTANAHNFTIPDGGTNSNVLSFAELGDAAQVVLYAPAAINGGGTLTFEISRDNSTWVTLNDGTNDIGPPAAGKGRPYTEFLGANYVRVHGTSVVTGDTVWGISKTYTT